LLALFTGAVMVVAGVGRLGFIADLLSKPTMLGYMNGLALTILVGQLPKLLGFSVDADNFVGELIGFVTGVAQGDGVPSTRCRWLAQSWIKGRSCWSGSLRSSLSTPDSSHLLLIGPSTDAGLTVNDAEDAVVAAAPIVGAWRAASAAARSRRPSSWRSRWRSTHRSKC
jgi:hypothetical protein